MEANKTNFLFGLSIFFALLLFFFLSYIPLQKELHLTPEWTSDITMAKQDAAETETLLPFKFEKTIGYFTPSGKITLSQNVPYKASISKNFFALFDFNSRSTEVFDSRANLLFSLDGAGFPFFQGENVFLMLAGGSAFAVADRAQGSLISTYENSAPITAFQSSKSAIAAGYANGDFLIFDLEGKMKIALEPGGSEFPVILGCAVSNDAAHFACVAGINPQRIILYKNEDSYQQVVFHKNLKNSSPRQTFVCFSKDGGFAYFDAAGELWIVDTKSLSEKSFSLEGKILDIQETEEANCVFVLSKHENCYRVSIFEDFNKFAGNFSFEAQSAFILTEKKSLYVGSDGKISCITISKE